MKVLLISLLILSFGGISALSFVAMYHDGSHGDELCVTKTATGLDCPANPFAFADFHLSLLKGFSNAYFGDFFNTYLALITFLLLGLVFDLFGHNSFKFDRRNHYQLEQFFESFTPLAESRISYWLSLHENSPTTH